MGKWSQYRHRGGPGAPGLAVAAPELVADGDPDLEWTWLGPDPASWYVEQSPNGVSAWTVNEIVPGGTQDSHSQVAAFYYRVVGRTAGGIALTGYSNVVLQF